jgi:hypothetical protein
VQAERQFTSITLYSHSRTLVNRNNHGHGDLNSREAFVLVFSIAFLQWRLAHGILTPLSRYGRSVKESHFAKNAQPA